MIIGVRHKYLATQAETGVDVNDNVSAITMRSVSWGEACKQGGAPTPEFIDDPWGLMERLVECPWKLMQPDKDPRNN